MEASGDESSLVTGLMWFEIVFLILLALILVELWGIETHIGLTGRAVYNSVTELTTEIAKMQSRIDQINRNLYQLRDDQNNDDPDSN